MTAADTFRRSRGLLRPVETPGPVLRSPPRQPKMEVIMSDKPRPDMAQADADAQLWDGWPSDASDAWIDAGKPTPRPAPRNPWPLVGLIIVVATIIVIGYALWRVAVAIW